MAIETLGAALRQINRLFANGVVAGLSDAQLLERFLAQTDAEAFAALVARHGPMVLSVCRGILREPRDAEDAFQATFLILVEKGNTIRWRETLAGWLYQVAHRAAIRRRAHERQAGAVAAVAAGSAPMDQLLEALHDEIARLPDEYRLAIVLCDLEGTTQKQAAAQLHWSERKLRYRLAGARARLKRRLGRRGLAPDGAALGGIVLRGARTAVPPAWPDAAVRAALDVVNQTAATGAVSSAGRLASAVLKIMLFQKLKLVAAVLLGAGLLAWVASAIATSRKDDPQQPAALPIPIARQAPLPAKAQPLLEPDPIDEVGKFPVQGRVLGGGGDGNPVAGAEIYVRHEVDWNRPADELARWRQPTRITTSDAEGRFRFELDKAASDDRSRNDPAWHSAQIAAVAPGFGPAWITVEEILPGNEATLWLVRDDVPIHGRIVGADGRPAAGVNIRVEKIGVARTVANLDAAISSGQVDDDIKSGRWFSNPTWLGRHGTWTTDADGRFKIEGIGRNRIVTLELDSSALEHASLCAIARLNQTTPVVRPTTSPFVLRGIVGDFASFPPGQLVGATSEIELGPCKPIVGVVRLKGSGRRLPDVRLVANGQATSFQVETTTDAEGRFRLDGLPKCPSYEIRAVPLTGTDPYLGAKVTVPDTDGFAPIETAFELPKGIIVTGRLFDKTTGRAVQASEVDYVRLPIDGNHGETVTSRSGTTDVTFRITVPPGDGVLFAKARGRELPYTLTRMKEADKVKLGGEQGFAKYDARYHAYQIIAVPAGAESFTADLELTRGLTRAGRLISPDGQPVIGAQCCGVFPTWGYTKTLGDDTFRVFALEPGRSRQIIFAHQARRLVGSVVVNDDNLRSDAPLVVRLVEPGAIEGRLIDDRGRPMAWARIAVMTRALDGENLPPDYRTPSWVWPDGEIFRSDMDGRFQIVGLKPGVGSSLKIQNKYGRELYLPVSELLKNVDIKPGEVREVGDVKVTASAR
jgi:RNA polymerase sigma factor (sigma-70 family)